MKIKFSKKHVKTSGSSCMFYYKLIKVDRQMCLNQCYSKNNAWPVSVAYDGSRTVLRWTIPRPNFPLQTTIPRRHFPDRQFPDGQFPKGQFPERAIPRTDISLMDSSLNPNNIFLQTDISPTDISLKQKEYKSD